MASFQLGGVDAAFEDIGVYGAQGGGVDILDVFEQGGRILIGAAGGVRGGG